MHIRVHSEGYFGGDGFALWILSTQNRHHLYNYYTDKISQIDTSKNEQLEEKLGTIFGMPAHFDGIGILFDTYDNDNLKDNPTVSVIRNDANKSRVFDHNKDFVVSLLPTSHFPRPPPTTHPSPSPFGDTSGKKTVRNEQIARGAV